MRGGKAAARARKPGDFIILPVCLSGVHSDLPFFELIRRFFAASGKALQYQPHTKVEMASSQGF